MIDARLLRELSLRHLLGLELGSKPLVERATVLGGHDVVGRSVHLSKRLVTRCPHDHEPPRTSCITRWYRPHRRRPGRPRSRCGAVGIGSGRIGHGTPSPLRNSPIGPDGSGLASYARPPGSEASASAQNRAQRSTAGWPATGRPRVSASTREGCGTPIGPSAPPGRTEAARIRRAARPRLASGSGASTIPAPFRSGDRQ
jgi:hypothetical protein